MQILTDLKIDLSQFSAVANQKEVDSQDSQESSNEEVKKDKDCPKSKNLVTVASLLNFIALQDSKPSTV